ncbi:hypothetical protein F7725_014300, partial [Dissostichus mawsoni]
MGWGAAVSAQHHASWKCHRKQQKLQVCSQPHLNTQTCSAWLQEVPVSGNRVISALPHLKNVDYSSVTCAERRMVTPGIKAANMAEHQAVT